MCPCKWIDNEGMMIVDERGRWWIHVRCCVSAAGRYKPQKPFSSCLKECNTVTLCICLWRVCAWASVCSGARWGRVCHMIVMFSDWLCSEGLCSGRRWQRVKNVMLLELLSVCFFCCLHFKLRLQIYCFTASHSCCGHTSFTVPAFFFLVQFWWMPRCYYFYKCYALSALSDCTILEGLCIAVVMQYFVKS